MNCSSTTGIELWAALPTPFLPDGELDEAGLRLNIQHCLEAGLDGVYCNGLMGEGWALTPQERRRIVETIVQEAAGRLQVTPVTSGATLAESIKLSEHARQAGATYSVLEVPAAATDEEVLAYFDAVFAEVDMPFVIFNPGDDGSRKSRLSERAFAELCRRDQTTILKTTASSEENARLRAVAHGSGVRVSDPLEENFLDNLVEHEQALLYCDPEGYLYQSVQDRPIETYIRLWREGRVDEARAVFDSMNELRRVYRKWIIGPLEAGEMPVAALKHWCELIGMAGGPVRPPSGQLTPTQAAELEQDLQTALTALDAHQLLARS